MQLVPHNSFLFIQYMRKATRKYKRKATRKYKGGSGTASEYKKIMNATLKHEGVLAKNAQRFQALQNATQMEMEGKSMVRNTPANTAAKKAENVKRFQAVKNATLRWETSKNSKLNAPERKNEKNNRVLEPVNKKLTHFSEPLGSKSEPLGSKI